MRSAAGRLPSGRAGRGRGDFQLHPFDGDIRLRRPMAIDDDEGNLALPVGPGPGLPPSPFFDVPDAARNCSQLSFCMSVIT